MRLPRTARLLRPADFAALRSAARRLNTPLFTLEYRFNEAGRARLGMAVSRRVSKRAVTRNRIRRVVREQFRLNQGRLPALDLLVIARTACAGSSNADLQAAFSNLCERLAALKDDRAPGTMRADT